MMQGLPGFEHAPTSPPDEGAAIPVGQPANGAEPVVNLALAQPISVTQGAEAAVELQVVPPLELSLVTSDPPQAVQVPVPISTAPAGWRKLAKRAIDLVGSGFLLVLLSPLLLAVAGAIRLTSAGPALFIHERIGRDGRGFRMFKFRSMRINAHDERTGVAHLNEAGGPIFKIRRDPRVTAVGRLIRRFSIDEVPQLLNVLRGEMSLVGPRPPLPEEYSTYGPRERQRMSVTPGITCIWQVSGRSDLDFETWVEMDLEYIASWSLWLDLKLLLKTVPAALIGRGAY
jgi:lipopolysaccharide/colanic/teichoic acid biosynthesis glycosyltransferase